MLSSPDKRKEYDEQRTMFGSGAVRVAASASPAGAAPAARRASTSPTCSVASSAAGARTRSTTGQPRRGADVETEARISFEQAIEGVTVPLRTTSDAACRDCRGTGARAGTVPRVCPVLRGQRHADVGVRRPVRHDRAVHQLPRARHGRGRSRARPATAPAGRPRPKTMQVRIPAGVKDGQRIRLRGRGASGERGGPDGDLYVDVHVDAAQAVRPQRGQPHRHGAGGPRRGGARGDHLGADARRPPVSLKIPPGTPTGRTFRARGKGAMRRDGSRATCW